MLIAKVRCSLLMFGNSLMTNDSDKENKDLEKSENGECDKREKRIKRLQEMSIHELERIGSFNLDSVNFRSFVDSEIDDLPDESDDD